MNPSAVKRYLQSRGMAPLSDLANRFGCDAEAMRGVLDFWMRKGRVQALTTQRGCASGCGGCSGASCPAPESSAVYVWLDETAVQRQIVYIEKRGDDQ